MIATVPYDTALILYGHYINVILNSQWDKSHNAWKNKDYDWSSIPIINSGGEKVSENVHSLLSLLFTGGMFLIELIRLVTDH